MVLQEVYVTIFIDMKKLMANTWKVMIKIKNRHILNIVIYSISGWGMSQKLPVNNFGWIKYTFQFDKDFIKNYNEESDEGCFYEFDVQHLEKLHELHNGLPFLPERMKIEKVGKHVANLYDKTGYVIHIRNLK